MTTLTNYGEIAYQHQEEIIRDLANPQKNKQSEVNEIAEKVFKN